MNKLIATGALATLAFGTAHAESVNLPDITLYGRVAGGYDYVNHIATPDGGSKSVARFGSNQCGISWWGINVEKDMGGGLKGIVNLESMFTSGSGETPVGLFNRWAAVGVKGDFGTVRLGRAMSLMDTDMWAIDPFGEQTIATANLVNGRNWGPRSNAITFDSVNYGPVSFSLQAGLGNKPGNNSSQRQLSAVVRYKVDNLDVRALYEEIRDTNGKFSSLYSASRDYTIGATYKIGDLKLLGGYGVVKSDTNTTPDSFNLTGANENKMGWFGANYVIGATTLIAGAYHANINRDGGSATLYGVGAQHYLTKNIMLYAAAATVKNKGAAAFSMEMTGDTQPLPGTSQEGAFAGIMLNF